MKDMLSKIVLLVLSLSLWACGDKGGTDVIPATPLQTTNVTSTANYYYMYKGSCYDDKNRSVTAQYCDGLIGYYQVNGYCYNTRNVKVNSDYCRKVPLRVLPVCAGADYYTFNKAGKKSYLKCDRRGCMGKRVYDRHSRLVLCRS